MSQSSILHSSLCCIFLTWSQEAQKPGDGSIPPCCPCPQGSHLQSCTTWWQCVPSPPLVKASLLPQSSPGSQARRYPGWLTQQRVTSWQRDSRAFLCHMPAPSLLLTREAFFPWHFPSLELSPRSGLTRGLCVPQVVPQCVPLWVRVAAVL